MPPSPYIYLDHAATTPMAPSVLEAMMPYLTGHYGNPSSLHPMGYAARQAIETAKMQLAAYFACNPAEWLFTSGATEANNLILQGVPETLGDKGHVILSAIEHPASMAAAERLVKQHPGWTVTCLPVTAEGGVMPYMLRQALTSLTRLVSVMHGNNEVGTLQDIATLSAITHAHGAYFHTDAVQTAGTLPLSMADWPHVDYLSLSAHKCYGPKGIGALFIRHGAPVPNGQIVGGGQQQNQRSGTENVAGIVALATAIGYCRQWQEAGGLDALYAVQTEWRDHLQTALGENGLRWNGPWEVANRVPGNLHISLPGLRSDALVNQLGLRGFCVSSGSACHSARLTPSHVLMAMGQDEGQTPLAHLRISLGHDLEVAQQTMEAFLLTLTAIVERAGKKHA